MKCPFCGKEMTEGFVQSSSWIFFTEKKHKFYFRPNKKDTVLSTRNYTCPTAKAWHCSNCMKVVVDYEEAWIKENQR